MINFQVISGGNNAGGAGRAAGYVQESVQQHVARDGTSYTTGYYSEKGGAPSNWIGAGAQAQGLGGSVEKDDLVKAMLGQVRDGPDISGRGGKKETDERRYAMDLTLSAPKSVSIAALAGGDARLLDAHDRAVAAAMRYAEEKMVYARIGKGGADSEFTGSMTAASFRHETARTVDGVADPQLHTHTLILNQTQRADGTWAAARLDFGKNNEKFQTLDSIYKAELAKGVREAGYSIEHTADGFEIAGITRDQIDAFSRRKQQIDEALGEHGLSRETATAQQRDNANTATRGGKSQMSDVDQKYEWRERAREQGLDLENLKANGKERGQSEAITAEDAVKSAIHHLSERDTVFSETALLDESLKSGLGHVTHADIEKAIKERAGGLVSAGEADRGEGKSEPQFTTRSAIFREAEILHRAREGKGKAEAIISSTGLENQRVVSFTEKEMKDGKRSYGSADAASAFGGPEKVGTLSQHRLRNLQKCCLDANEIGQDSDVFYGHADADRPGNPDLRRADDDPRVKGVIKDFEERKGFTLGDGQKAAVALSLTSTDRHIGIVGAAGAGKTTSMELIVEQYKKAGYEVIGVAPSAAAAKELESAGCNDTRTLASALLKKQEQDGEKTPKRLYIMDESGMVSAKDMDAFLRKADAERARTILVGDPRQLAAVEAGSPYAQMLDSGSIDHVRIDEIQRQKDPQLREIAQAFARGDAAKAVELARPYMRQVENKAELAETAAKAYLDLSPDERAKTLLLAGTNATRQAINDLVREGLQNDGTLGNRAISITARDKLDLTREAATRAENYQPKNGGQVVVKINAQIKDKAGNVEAARGSQWRVTDNREGKLTLESLDGQKREIIVDPAKVKLSAYESRGMELREGDQVMFRENGKERGITNGMQAKVANIDDETGRVTIATKTGERITLDSSRAESLDYSYAKTVHMSQGATEDNTIVVGEAGRVATAEAAGVANTRERMGLTIITDDIQKLCKSWSKYADRQNALDASKTRAPESYTEINNARQAADRDLGKTGEFAKKRAAANEASNAAAPDLGDIARIPDALDPDFGSEKFQKKMDAAMANIADKQGNASNAESTVIGKSDGGGKDGATAQEPDEQQAPTHVHGLETELELDR